MNRILLIVAVFVWMLSPFNAFGQEWRGIQLLRSNCEDVKRSLGVDKCEYPQTTYHLNDETVTISFKSCACPITCYNEGGGWNVPKGTVETIVRQLHKQLPIANFEVNSSKWSSLRTDFIGEIIYSNRDDGMTLSAIDGGVVTIKYYPSIDKFRDLRCPDCFSRPSNSGKNDLRSPVFSAYGEGMTPDREKLRLNNFALELQKLGLGAKVYIVAYDACFRSKVHAQNYAIRARKYLIGRGIGSRRIIIIEGGRRESMLIELHGRKRNMPPPKTFGSIYPGNESP